MKDEGRPDRSLFADLLCNDFVGEGAGCLIEAAFTGCAPVLLIAIGVPVWLFWT